MWITEFSNVFVARLVWKYHSALATRSHWRLRTIGLRSIIFKIHLTVQLFSKYYLLYKEISFLATLTSMSFFKRSGTYNLYSFRRIGYKNDMKTAKNMGTHVFMQASDCVIIYLNKNKFCVALSTICYFLHINKQTCYFHLFGRNKFFRL